MRRRAADLCTVLASAILAILSIAPATDAEMSGPLVGSPIGAIAVAPGGNPVYVGTTSNGIFRLDVDTELVEAINEGLQSMYTRRIVVDPADPSRIYAAVNNRVFLSENGGRQWISMSQGIRESGDPIEQLWMSSLDRDLLLLQTYYGAVYRTDDGGEHWRRLYHPSNDAGDGTALAATMDGRTIYTRTRGIPFCRSRDGGNTWEELVVDPPRLEYTPNTLALSADEKVLYAGAGALPDSKERSVVVYRSFDGGDSWEGLGYTPIEPSRDIWFRWGGTRHLLPDPAVPGLLYAGTTEGTFYTTDGGTSWQPLGGQPLSHGEWWRRVTALALDSGRSRLYIGSAQGLVYVATPPHGNSTTAAAISWGRIKSFLTREIKQ